MRDLGVMVYPWDIVAEGAAQVVDSLASRGATRLDIATAYHSAEVIAPRRASGVVTVAEANTIHLPVGSGQFTDLKIPQSSIALQHPNLFEELAQTANDAGLALGGWAIAFHNTDLATQHPDVAITSCFGDKFTHGVCPSNPRSQTYVLELVDAVCRTGYFDRLLLESLTYLLYSHGHPHELWGARLDATTRYLLSLCFCQFCTEKASDTGIDVPAFKAQVAKELHRTWNVAHPYGRDSDDGAELTSLHFGWPELRAYTDMRMRTVSELTAAVHHTTAKHGVKLDMSAAVWGRPAQTNWIEGVDVIETLRNSDGFVLESYFPTTGEVAREIDHTMALQALAGDNAASITVALTLWESMSASRGEFRAKVETVACSGVDALTLYNYGTATAATLEWIRDAAEIIGKA